MTLPDTNVWLALTLSKHSHHAAAVSWLDSRDEPESVAFCRATHQSFLRLLTTAAIMALYGNAPLTNAQAWAAFDAFLADDRVVFQAEPPGVVTIWKRLACRRTSSPKLWMDGYLAAVATASGAQLVTTDQAFLQFQDLDVLVIRP